MLRQQTLLVWANPWHATDHFGRPAGHVSRERTGSTPGHPGYIGCEIVASAPIEVEKGSAASPDQDTCWHFSRDAVKVLDNGFYRSKVRSGEVFPADEATAKKCRTPDYLISFRPLDECVAVAKAEAFAKWRAAFGEDPEDVDPYERPKPNGVDAPQDIAERSGAERVATSQADEVIAPSIPRRLRRTTADDVTGKEPTS